MAKIEAWQRLPKSNDKPARPEVALFFPPADCTHADKHWHQYREFYEPDAYCREE